VDLVKIPATARTAVRGDKGRALKVGAREIAHLAAKDFRTLTGSPPTRARGEGKFLHFLGAVFAALGRHDDSVENLGREAVDWWSNLRLQEEEESFKKLRETPPPPDISAEVRAIEPRPPGDDPEE